MLRIRYSDIQRATLPVRSGNEGWIGVSPKGDEYHVVVPVDVQIARGVMACNRPTDGTPFGGYDGWLYFRCAPYEDRESDDRSLHRQKALEAGKDLISWLASFQIEARIESDESSPVTGPGTPGEAPHSCSSEREHKDSLGAHHLRWRSSRSVKGFQTPGSLPFPSEEPSVAHDVGRGRISCPECGSSWRNVAGFIKDTETELKGYRACTEDFRLGTYVFVHMCGGMVELPVSRFARSHKRGKSLIGTHACPGFCYYETSLVDCSAACEGSSYRRIARKLRSRRTRRQG